MTIKFAPKVQERSIERRKETMPSQSSGKRYQTPQEWEKNYYPFFYFEVSWMLDILIDNNRQNASIQNKLDIS